MLFRCTENSRKRPSREKSLTALLSGETSKGFRRPRHSSESNRCHSLTLPGEDESNAIRCPSGDQIGFPRCRPTSALTSRCVAHRLPRYPRSGFVDRWSARLRVSHRETARKLAVRGGRTHRPEFLTRAADPFQLYAARNARPRFVREHAVVGDRKRGVTGDPACERVVDDGGGVTRESQRLMVKSSRDVRRIRGAVRSEQQVSGEGPEARPSELSVSLVTTPESSEDGRNDGPLLPLHLCEVRRIYDVKASPRGTQETDGSSRPQTCQAQ